LLFLLSLTMRGFRTDCAAPTEPRTPTSAALLGICVFADLPNVDGEVSGGVKKKMQHASLWLSLILPLGMMLKQKRHNVASSFVSGQTRVQLPSHSPPSSLLSTRPLKSWEVCLNPVAPPPPLPHFTSQPNPRSASIRRKSTNSPSASHVPRTQTHMLDSNLLICTSIY